MTSARYLAPAVLVCMLTGACGNGVQPVAGSPSASTTVALSTLQASASALTTVSVPPTTSPADRLPVLAIARDCYGECAYTWPQGLSETAVYADGSVFIATDGPPGAATSTGTLTTHTLQLSDAEFAAVQNAAATGGLDRGGVHAAGTTANTADGGGTVFYARHGEVSTVIEAPNLWEPPPGESDFTDGDPKQRAALLAVQKLLDGLSHRSDAKPENPSAYVALIRSSPGDAANRAGPNEPDVLKPWPDATPLASYPDRVGDATCALFPAAGTPAPLITALTKLGFGSPFSSGGKNWSVIGRPLMPHENTCADVAAWHTLLAPEARAKAIAP